MSLDFYPIEHAQCTHTHLRKAIGCQLITSTTALQCCSDILPPPPADHGFTSYS